jgi:hypothetical protein
MAKFIVKWKSVEIFDNVITLEANTPEEAIAFVKENPQAAATDHDADSFFVEIQDTRDYSAEVEGSN